MWILIIVYYNINKETVTSARLKKIYNNERKTTTPQTYIFKIKAIMK